MRKRKKSKKPSQTHLPEDRHSLPPTLQSACYSPWLKVALALRCLRSDPLEAALWHETRRAPRTGGALSKGGMVQLAGGTQ